MVKNKLLYATIAAMLMGAVFTGCSNTDNNNINNREPEHCVTRGTCLKCGFRFINRIR